VKGAVDFLSVNGVLECFLGMPKRVFSLSSRSLVIELFQRMLKRPRHSRPGFESIYGKIDGMTEIVGVFDFFPALSYSTV
jgi:hypothetical protein